MKKELSLWSRFGAFAICGAIVLAGCGGGGEEAPSDSSDTPPAEEAETAEASADELTVTETPTELTGINGNVSFEGTPPERKEIKAEGDAFCMEHHAETPLLSEQVVVGADGGLANVFVYLKDPPAGDHTAPEAPVVLDQIGCAYVPHVLGVMAGQTLEIRNSDKTTHNVRGIARKNRAMNYAQPVDSPPRTKTFKNPEMEIRMKCDLHPWMTGFVFVMDHPFYGVTDESGSFFIPSVPAGEYEVIAWHEQFDEREGTVTVDADGNGSVNFTFSE